MNSATVQFEEAPRILFFDANFFNALVKGEFHHHMADLKSDLRVSIKLPFRPWRTAFSFMEWIGLNPQSLPKPEPFDLTSASEADFITPAYHHYEKCYASVQAIDRENLEALSTKQRGYVSPLMADVWDNAMRGIFENSDVSGWLRFALCFDAVHKLEVPLSHRSHYWSDLVAGAFFGADPRIRNLSKFRLAYQMWHPTRNTLTARGVAADQRACMEDAQRLLRLENSKDYLDSDLVHVAAYGVENSDGSRHRAICLTCDSPDVVIMRIRLYKGLLSYVRKLYQEKADAEGCPKDYETSHNGEVHCFDSQGNLVRLIDVVSETPALLFLGKEPS